MTTRFKILRPEQLDNVNYVVSLFKTKYNMPKVNQNDEFTTDVVEREIFSCIDQSTTGAGKTFMSLKIAEKLGMSVIIICPNSVKDSWIEEINELQTVTMYKCNQYCKKSKMILCSPIGPFNFVQFKKSDNILFKSDNEILKFIINFEKVLFIFDEASNFKNETTQIFEAVYIISKLIRYTTNTKCKMLFLSAYPITKITESITMLKYLGILTVPDKDKNNTNSLLQLKIFCNVLYKNNIFDYDNLEESSEFFYNVLQNYILHYNNLKDVKFLSTSKTVPETKLVNVNIEMLIVNVDDYPMKIMLKEGYDLKYENLISYNYSKQQRENILLEYFKCYKVAEIVYDKLINFPDCKITIFCMYTDSIRLLSNLLEDFKPLTYIGKVNINERTKIINKFQENNNNYRIFIGTIAAAGEGLNLDDKYGNHKRYSYIMPTYNYQLMLQALGRTYRQYSTNSDVNINIVISEYGGEEKMIELNKAKNEVLSSIGSKELNLLIFEK